MANFFDKYDAPKPPNHFDQFDTPPVKGSVDESFAVAGAQPAPNQPLQNAVNTRAFDTVNSPLNQPSQIQGAGGGGFESGKAQQSAGNQPNLLGDFAGERLAASQGTMPGARGKGNNFDRPFLGEIIETDGDPLIRDAAGNISQIDPKKHVAVRDSQSGKILAFERTDETEESFFTSMFRLIAPGLVSNAPSRLPGGVINQTTRQATRAANRSTRQAANAAHTAAQRNTVQAFDATGIKPNIPAVSDNRIVQSMTNQASRVPFVGAPIRRAAQGVREGIQEGVGTVSRAFGNLETADDAGGVIAEGLNRFKRPIKPGLFSEATTETLSSVIGAPARNTSFTNKSAALYERADRLIPSGTSRVMTNAQKAMAKVLSPFDNVAATEQNATAIRAKLSEQGVGGILGAIENGTPVTFSDARTARTLIRRLNKVGEADRGLAGHQIDTIYNAITRDMHEMARQAGGSQALGAIRRADTFFAAANTRLDSLKKLFSATSDEQLFAALTTAASNKTNASMALLTRAQRTLRADEWDDVAGVIISRLGKPSPGSTGEFSPAKFLTDFNNISPRGRAVLFRSTGRGGLADQLDALSEVARAEKRFESVANFSNTGDVGISVAAGTAAVLNIVGTIGAGIGGNAMARALMSEKAVRWMVGAEKIAAQPKPNPRQWFRHVAALEQILTREVGINSVTAESIAQSLRPRFPIAADDKQQPNQQ